MTFDLDLYPQGYLAVTLPISYSYVAQILPMGGDDHFQFNRSKDKVTRAIRIFGGRGEGYPSRSRSTISSSTQRLAHGHLL